MVQGYGGQVVYVDENFGDSELAERFGVRRYPAVFVDDALVARPQDFHLWQETQSGRYTPWRNAESHARFQADLRRMIDVRRAGGELESRKAAPDETRSGAELPQLVLSDLAGNEVSTASFRGRLVVVELWASWCPPCLSTLDWLKELSRGDRQLAVLTVAVASDEDDVRQLAAALELPFPVILGTDEVVSQFGNLLAVPTLHVFDREGRSAGVFYGAPPDLHERVAGLLQKLR